MCSLSHQDDNTIHKVVLHRLIVIQAPTIAQQSIASVPQVANTCEGPECVGAGSVCMTRIQSHTFIDIWEEDHNGIEEYHK